MSKQINYDILDLTKLILSFMVVAIHTELFPMILYPWLRIAVPLFFVISSFLLNEKIKREKDKKLVLKKYIIRLIKLYIFWFIMLLPLTIYIRRNWFSNGIFTGVLISIKNLFLGSTFAGSWFITATIFGTMLVYNKKNTKIKSLIIYTSIYIVCTICSSYSFFINNENVKNILKIIQPQFTFLSSIIFIYIGKIQSDEEVKSYNRINNIINVIASTILLFIEWKLIYKMNNTFNNDCYLFLIPLVYFLFCLIKSVKINLRNSKNIRNFSTFIYPFHIAIIPIEKVLYNYIFKREINTILLYILTIIFSIIVFATIKKIENKKIFRLLKYSH